jgi:hypothetical protein
LYKGRAKNKAKQMIATILALESTLGLQKKTITKLEATLALGDLDDITELSEQLQDAREHYQNLETGLRRKRAQLGVTEQEDLTRLRNDAFLRLRMNALALKQRVRDRLRHRKFEIERLERSYRHSVNGKSELCF